MCGIVGLLTIYKKKITEKILKCIKQLENRGYDSVGFYMEGIEEIIKSIEKIDDIRDRLLHNKYESNLSLAHTRWATHGIVNEVNCHPHVSNNDKLVVVHNGIIDNYTKLRDFLISQNYNFKSETDTEVISNMMEYYSKKKSKDETFDTVIKNTTNNLIGTWALVIANKDEPNKLYATCNGCPLVIGINNNNSDVIVSSEISGFYNYVDKYFVLNTNDIVEIKIINNNIKITSLNNINYEYKLLKRECKLVDSPHPYKHWTIKEIKEQPTKIHNLVKYYIKNNTIDFKFGTSIFSDINNIIFIGCGTSLCAGKVGSYFFMELCDFVNINVIDASEFTENHIPKSNKTMAIFLSQSGETKDVHNVQNIIRKSNYNITTLGIVNTEESLIARESDYVIYVKAGKEYGVASTKCFTLQVLVLYILAIHISIQTNKITKKNTNTYIESILMLPEQIQLLIDETESKIHKLVNTIDNNNSIIMLGKGKSYAIAEEGALKIKELCYIHAEAFAAGSLKHGPLALLNDETNVIIFNNIDTNSERILNAHHEIVSRGSKVISIGNYIPNIKNTTYIKIPNNKHLAFLLSIIPIQLIAYYISVKKKNNPDFPRNLAKSVVVY